MTKKKEEREYAKDRMEYFREFHRVIAPVVVLYEPAETCLIVTSPPSLLSVFDAAFFKAFARLISDKQQQFHLQE